MSHTKYDMGAIKTIEKEITFYLGHLSKQQKEVVLSVVKSFAGEEAWWDEKVYIKEMDNRIAEMEKGNVKVFSLEQLEKGARKAYKNRKPQ